MAVFTRMQLPRRSATFDDERIQQPRPACPRPRNTPGLIAEGPISALRLRPSAAITLIESLLPGPRSLIDSPCLTVLRTLRRTPPGAQLLPLSVPAAAPPHHGAAAEVIPRLRAGRWGGGMPKEEML